MVEIRQDIVFFPIAVWPWVLLSTILEEINKGRHSGQLSARELFERFPCKKGIVGTQLVCWTDSHGKSGLHFTNTNEVPWEKSSELYVPADWAEEVLKKFKN